MSELPRSPSFKDMERSGWQAKAEGYDNFVGVVTTQAIEPTLNAAAVTAGKHVLDVASGPGYGAGGAIARGASAIGIDFASSMVELASKSFPAGEFRLGDGENLAFNDASFDTVICMFGLLHMPQPEKAIAEAYRVLRSEGRYAFTVWDTPETHEFFALIMSAIQAHGNMDVPLPPAPPIFRFSDMDECRTALLDTGFSNVRVETLPLVWKGKSGQDCLDLIYNGSVRVGILLERQSPEVVEKIHSAVIEGAETFRRGADIELAWPAVLASASKP